VGSSAPSTHVFPMRKVRLVGVLGVPVEKRCCSGAPGAARVCGNFCFFQANFCFIAGPRRFMFRTALRVSAPLLGGVE
jgi:hypothetical protein